MPGQTIVTAKERSASGLPLAGGHHRCRPTHSPGGAYLRGCPRHPGGAEQLKERSQQPDGRGAGQLRDDRRDLRTFTSCRG
jgi:hypothetical protein